MGIVSKTAVKANFESGDRPEQQAYDDFIDSVEFFKPDFLGIYEIISTASATARPRSTIGLQVIGASSKNDIYSLVGITIGGSAGLRVINQSTAQAALSSLSVPSFGANLVQSSATSSAIGLLGGGTAGIQLAGVSATSQANSFLNNLESVFVTSYTTGNVSASATDPNIFREFEIALPSANTQISSVEILLRVHPVQAQTGVALRMQMHRNVAPPAGPVDYDSHASAYQTVMKITDENLAPVRQTTAALASGMYVAWASNSGIGFTQSQSQPGVWGTIKIDGFNATARRTTMLYEGIGHRFGLNGVLLQHAYGIHNTAAVVDKIKVFFTQPLSAAYAEARVYAQST